MITKSVSTLLTSVVGLLVISGAPAWGADAPAPAQPAANTYQRSQIDVCQDAISKIKPLSNNKSILARAEACYGKDVAHGAAALDPSDPDYEEPTKDNCSEGLADTCNDPRDLKEEDKTAKQSVRDAQTTLNSAKKDLDALKAAKQKELNQMTDALNDLPIEYATKTRQMKEALDAQISASTGKKKQMLQEMRKAFLDLDTQYAQLRSQYRATEAEIGKATNKWETTCRQEAQQKLNEANQRLQKRTDDRNKLKLNYSSTSVAGATNREQAIQNSSRLMDYANGYKDCMAGLSPAGAGASEAVKNAKAALDQASKDIADRSALIEKQRMDFNTKYQEDIAQEDDAIQQIYKSAQSAAEEFNAAYALKVQRLTRDIQQAQVNAQSEIQNASQAVTIANSAVSEAQSESMTANNRLTCAQKNNLPLTTTAGSKLSDQIDTLAQNNVYCAGATTACAGLANSAESLKKICPDPTANTSSTSSKGKPAATGAGKSVH